jgi:hypothetical protein
MARAGSTTSVDEERGALALRVTESFLNDLAAALVGGGIEVPAFRNTFQLPMMGPLELEVGMTILGVSFRAAAHHGDRLMGTLRAAGRVEIMGDSPMPALPGAAVVRADVLVAPRIGWRPDGGFVAELLLPDAELVGVELEHIDGMETDAGMARQLSEMLFAAVGGELFDGLAANLGHVGMELDAEQAQVLHDIGVLPEDAWVHVGNGELTVVLPSVEDHHGGVRPPVAPPDGLGLAVSSGALGPLAARVVAANATAPLPIQVGLRTDGSEIGTSLRSRRLVDSPLVPDFRTVLRSRVEPRLVGDALEIQLRSAWVELPGTPTLLSSASRALGSFAGVLPPVRLPRELEVPIEAGSNRTVRLRLEQLDVTADGVSSSVSADFAGPVDAAAADAWA